MSRIIFLLLAIAPLFGCGDQSSQAQDQKLERLAFELEQLRSNQEALTRELDTFRTLLRRLPSKASPVQRARYAPDGSDRDDPYLGSRDAPILLMAFTDFGCVPCQKFSEVTLPLLKQNYITPGSLTFILRDYPLPKNTHSKTASALAHCAGEQGHYWEMHDALFTQAEAVNDERWAKVYDTVQGVDAGKLESCLESGRYLKEIDLDIAEGKKLGARGAPGFFLGRKNANDGYDGVFIRGAQPFAFFKAQIDELLSGEKS